MSGGTSVGGGYMRQRHSQGYASSGDDLEDDACSRPISTSPSFSQNWIPLYVGMIGVCLNVLFFLNTSMLAWGLRKTSEKWEVTNASALPFIAVLGLLSFCLFCFALWPIWSFLTLPLVFTLFMACMVILPYLILGAFKKQTDSFCTE